MTMYSIPQSCLFWWPSRSVQGNLDWVQPGRPLKFYTMENLSQQKFFLYARKSTDVEEKQVRSIEDQITELRAFAKQENLNIVDELVEKQSAKIPGRPIFNDMLNRIESGS